MSFQAGNRLTLLIKKQVDKDTPITDFSTARALHVYEWSRLSARTIAALQESDATEQQPGSHVSAIGPGFSFGLYGRPDDLAFLGEAILGLNDNSGSADPTTHTATPDAETPYYSVMVVLPYSEVDKSPVYDGCRLMEGQFGSQDEGETELKLTGLSWLALGINYNGTVPDPLPEVSSELPFIHAEVAVRYNGVHLGTTQAISWTISRNGKRIQGDSGFRALDAVNGLFATTGQFTRYTQDDSMLRIVDTGSAAGTVPTSDIYSESASVLYNRGTGADNRQFLISSPEVAYETREEALNLDGSPFAEVLGFRTQPQAELVDHMALVTVNSLAAVA